jgi:ribosomal protein L37E
VMEERRHTHNSAGTRKGYSFRSGNKWYLIRCHACGLENYALMVSRGICSMCGYDANKDETRGTDPDDQA